MPTAEATLLPPIPEDRGSVRSLDAVGPLRVLGAMVDLKAKRTSSPAPEELAEESPESRRAPQRSDAFLKAR